VRLNFTASDDSLITPATAVTDATGRARVEWRLGSQEGVSTLTARLQQAAGVQATARATVLGGRPNFSSAGVVNAASYSTGPPGENPGLAPGGLYSAFGFDLAVETAMARSLPLPLNLAGTIVRVNGLPAPLLHVSPGQVNFQAPFELSGSLAQITIETPAGLSAPAAQVIRVAHPGVFFDPVTGTGAILNSDGTLLSQRPARRGEAVQVFATGFGAVEPAGRTGMAAASVPLSLTLNTPRVTIGGLDAEVKFSGLAPFLAGVYQVNVIVPPSLAPGRHRLRMEIGGLVSNEVFIDIQ
jgi:uncharacterized protein (TIGR03437 family)